jgi:C-terminal processing protease CtpA/Prc
MFWAQMYSDAFLAISGDVRSRTYPKLDYVTQAIDPVQFGTCQSEKGGRLGYVRIGSFADTTTSSVSQALRSLEV